MASSVTRRLRKPGRATSAEAISDVAGPSRSDAASASAISRGDLRSGRASFIARFVAKSPNAGLAGRSISTAGAADASSIAGSRPAATASAHACSTAARTRARTAAGMAVGSAELGNGGLLGGRRGSRPPS